MNTEQNHNFLHYPPLTYFRQALSFFESQQVSAGLQAVDAAIIFSNNSPFYMYQKVRILYKLGALKSCSELIVSQLDYFYKSSSLYILCRTIDYLQQINNFSVKQLQTILADKNIPYCLASHYKEWLTTKNKPFLSLIRNAWVHDHFSLCIGYCKLYIRYYEKTDDILFMMAYSYHMLGDYMTAKNIYLEYFNTTHKKAKATLHLAFIHSDLGEYETAIDYFKTLLSEDEQNKTYLTYLGDCYYLANKYASSIETYELITKYYPEDIQAWCNLTHVYGAMKKKWQAKRCLKQSEKLLKLLNHH